MRDTKIRYLLHVVYVDQFFGWKVTGINPDSSELSVSCCSFEVDVAMIEKLIII